MSGNPSGLTKDGRSPKVAAIENELKRALSRNGATKKLVSSWLRAANRGSASHLGMVLERLYPVVKNSSEGRQILEGIKLELSEGGASATFLSASSESVKESIGGCGEEPDQGCPQ